MTPANKALIHSVEADGRRLLRFLAANKRKISPLLIMTHDYPDPDSLASAAALQFIAHSIYGIRCEMVHGGVIGRTENREMVSRLKIPIRPLKRGELTRAKHIALVDTQPAFRNNSFPLHKDATIVIDQHKSFVPPNTKFKIVNLDCGATCVILAQALFFSKKAIPPRLATSLVYGILTDTLNFFRTHNPAVMQTYLKLLPHCDLPTLSKIQNPERSHRFFSTLSRGIDHAVSCRDVVVSHLGKVENPDLVSQTADFFLTYKDIKWSLLTGRYKNRMYMSLRSKKRGAEAGEILRDICGDRTSAGGHGGIAGGSFEVPESAPESAWRAEENHLLIRLFDRLRIPKKSPVRFPFHNKKGF